MTASSIRPAGPVVVTGGTGFIGVRLVAQLTALGADEVRVITRSARDRASSPPIQYVPGDITSPGPWIEALQGATAVFHVAGARAAGRLAGEQPDFERVNVSATSLLLRRAAAAGVKRFLHVSTTGIYGEGPPGAVSEDAASHPANPYERSKWTAESLVRDPAWGPMVRVIARPSNVFGEEHPARHLLTLFRTLRRGWFVTPRDHEGWTNFVHVADVASAVAALGLSASDGAYNINCPLPLLDFVSLCGAALEQPVRARRVAPWLLHSAASIADLLATVTGRPLPLTGRKVLEMEQARHFVTMRLEHAFPGWQTVGMAEGLRLTAAHYRRMGWL